MNKLSSAKSAMILSLSAVSQALACLSTICLILWLTGSDSGNGIVIEMSGKLAGAVGKLLAIAMSDMQPNPEIARTIKVRRAQLIDKWGSF
jgi:hypothetical protein